MSPRVGRAEESPRVVVRVAAPLDGAVLTRLRGQSNDLDVRLLEIDDRSVERDLAQELARADRDAADQNALAVIWFRAPSEEALVICVLVPATGRVFVRRLAAPTEERTVFLEQAAFILRSTLRALIAGLPVGVSRDEALRDEEPSPLREPPAEPMDPAEPPEPTTPAPHTLRARPTFDPEPWSSVDSPPTPSLATPPRWRPAFAVGWEAGYHGDWMTQGPTSRVAVEGRIWDVAFALRLGIPTEVAGQLGSLRVTEHVSVVSFGVPFRIGPRFVLRVSGEAGVAAFHRVTSATAPETAATPSRWLLSPIAGPRARVTYQTPITAGWAFGFGLEAAAYLMAPPRFDYRFASEEVAERHELWAVEPRLGITVDLLPGH